mmetsp:Transcript_15299/g.38140  ORF Transcript_15299/g.38140 Transcript_15299/m.38140 type:complete len:210 (-) Transcript_15299:322-951(-)
MLTCARSMRLATSRPSSQTHVARAPACSMHSRQRRVTVKAIVDNADATVEEIMIPKGSMVMLKPTMTCKEAARILLEKDVSGAPVVDESGALLGVLSESDLIWKGAGAPLDHTIIPPVYIGAFDLLIALNDNKQTEEELHKILAKTVKEAMTTKVVTIGPSATMAQAAQLMLAKKVNRLPVVESGKCVGVITRHDVLRGMVAAHSPFLG